MKNIKNRLSESSYSKMVKDDTDVALRARKIEDLKYLKKTIDSGSMTPELFNFIDVDGSLTAITGGMPAPSAASCEALSAMQSVTLDALIAQEEFTQRSMIVRMWRAFADWIVDFLSSNSWSLRVIRQSKSRLMIRPAETYGTPDIFQAFAIRMYRKDEFDSMVIAAGKLNELCDKIPDKPEDLKSWYENNKSSFETNFSEFGKYIDESNNVVTGSPKHIVQDSTCNVLGWRLNELAQFLTKVESTMDDEIKARRKFKQLERLFTSDDTADILTMSTIKKMVIASKQCSLFIGRRTESLLAQLERANTRSKYAINR